LKIILARDMLTNSNKSIKELSYYLGFESIHYFSRLFKNKVGVSPSIFAKSHQSGNKTGEKDGFQNQAAGSGL
jgi:AraC-like DNA-binding protein